eukprot:TRINITY_DN6760_c1_g4_i4.p1 TRINITY_DN6760_c1_g4~~TRINITY_DN6760_c1_g4_i4.p1  ORF type:complete len:199 (+),score=26.04 TRINITY_DN6760_c1_g4_i4:1-597(+)
MIEVSTFPEFEISLDEVRISAFRRNFEDVLNERPATLQIIFLDVDGVLALTPRILHPRCVELLLLLLNHTGAKVVLSSTWRYALDTKQRLVSGLVGAGCSPQIIIGQTPDMNPLDRPEEIRAWLKEHSVLLEAVGITMEYVVIDDWDLLHEDPSLEPRFVRTNHRQGLTAANVSRAAAILDPKSPIWQPKEASCCNLS